MEPDEQLPLSQSARSQKHGASCARRPAGFWHKFNEWWRGFKEATGTRPKVADVERFYSSTEGQAAWSGDARPCMKDVIMHCKGMRTRTEVREYFREYRRRRSKTRSSAGSETSAATSSEDHTRSTCTTHALGHDSDDATSPAPSKSKRPRHQAPAAAGAVGDGWRRPPLPPPATSGEVPAAQRGPPASGCRSQQRTAAAMQPGQSNRSAAEGNDLDSCGCKAAAALAQPIIQVHYKVARQRGTLNVASSESAPVRFLSSAAGESTAAADVGEHSGLLLQPSSDALHIAPLQLHHRLAGARTGPPAPMLPGVFETGHGSTMLGAGGLCNTNGTAVGSLPQMLCVASDDDPSESAAILQQRHAGDVGQPGGTRGQALEPPHSPRGHDAAASLEESCDELPDRSTDGKIDEAASQSNGTEHSLQHSQHGEVAPHGAVAHNSGVPKHGVPLDAVRQGGTEVPPPPAAGVPSWLLGAHLLPAPPLPPLSLALSEPAQALNWQGQLQPWGRANTDIQPRQGQRNQHVSQDSQPVLGGFTSAPLRLGLPLQAAFPPPATRAPAPAPKAHAANNGGGASAVPSCAWAAKSTASGLGLSFGATTGPHSLRMVPAALALPGHAHHAPAAWCPPRTHGFYTPAGGFAAEPYGWYPQPAPSAYGLAYPPRLYPVAGHLNSNSTSLAADAAAGDAAAAGAPPPGRISESGSEADGGNDAVPAAPARGVRTLRTTNNNRGQVPGSRAAPHAEAAARLNASATDLRWSPTSPTAGLTTNSVFCWAKASATIAAGDTAADPSRELAAAPSTAPAAARALGGSLAAADGHAPSPAGDTGGAPASLKRTRTPADATSSPISALIHACTAASGGRSKAGSGGAAACGALLPAGDDLGDLLNEAFNGGLWETQHDAPAGGFDPLMSLSGGRK